MLIVWLMVVCAFTLVWEKLISPAMQYTKAETYFNEEDYTSASAIYKELGEYKDSPQKLQFSNTMELYNDGDYWEALKEFEVIQDMPDVTYYVGHCYFEIGNYTDAVAFLEKVENDSKFKKDAVKYILDAYYQLGLEASNEGELSTAKEYLQKVENENAQSILDAIDKIEQEDWLGIYRSKEDDSEWMQIVCSINEDATYTYEVYRQSSLREDYSTEVKAKRDGTMLLIDDFNDYNVENNGGQWIEESTHQFQEDKSVYKDKGGIRAYMDGSEERIELKKQGENVVLKGKSRTSSFRIGSEEKTSTYSIVYIRQ